MDVHGQLVAIAGAATSPSNALLSAAQAVAHALDSDACSILLRDKSSRLQLRTFFGPPSSPTSSADEMVLAQRALRDLLPVAGSIAGSTVLAVPMLSRSQVIGAIVVRRISAGPFAALERKILTDVSSQIAELVESVRLIETLERGAEEADARVDRGDRDSRDSYPTLGGERTLQGVVASPGIAIGVATFRSAFPRKLVRRETTHHGDVAERARVRDAFERTRNDLDHLQTAAAAEIGEEQALIFGAHLLLLNDPMLTKLIDQGIAAGRSGPISTEDAFEEISRRLRSVPDPYIQERVEDIEDLRSRVLGHLVGRPREDDVDARLVVSTRTTPSLVVELKARGAVGIASELGGATSHGVLLARALGVPVVTGIEALTHQVQAGDTLIIDGDAGRVVIRPTPETRAAYEQRRQAAEQQHTQFARYRDQPPMTADGHRFELQANIALGADLAIARENGAQGIGLYRTEFPFIVRDALPSVAEQVRIYSRAYEAFPDAPVTFRLLDLAGDKFVASREMGISRDAFHGYRSIRILFDYPHVLRDQVQAFAIAAAGRELRLLIPMVTSVGDVVRIKELVDSSLASLSASSFTRGDLIYGAMVETPAAAEIVIELAREVDFFSIGTNDLVQYSLVVDREDPRMASEWHAYHPAILRVIRRVVSDAHRAGKRVTVCGEMAARPDLAIALLALGIDGLSVTPRVIPELKRALASVPLEPLRESFADVLALSSATEIATALQRYVTERKVDSMGSHNMGPEDEYFARRAGEIERDRDDKSRRDAERVTPVGQGDQAEPKPNVATQGDERGSSIVGAMSAAVRAMFGLRRRRSPSHR